MAFRNFCATAFNIYVCFSFANPHNVLLKISWLASEKQRGHKTHLFEHFATDKNGMFRYILIERELPERERPAKVWNVDYSSLVQGLVKAACSMLRKKEAFFA